MHQTPPFQAQKTPQKRAFRGMVSIRSATDYSPFGVQLENRNFLKAGLAEDFRMGFQGQEEDDEVKGEGNSVNYKYRMHDPRLGRFFAVDPLIKDYPHYSSYGFSGNIVIHNVELEGLENIYYWEKDQSGNWVRIDDWVDVQSNLDENINCYLYSYPNGGVEKAVYKSINQGGKDRWEHNGGLAPRDILSAHYDHESGYKSPSENSNSRSGDGLFSEGGDDAGNTGGSLGGEHGWHNGGKQLFFGTIGTILSGGTLATGGLTFTSVSGLVISLDDMTTGTDGKTIISDVTGMDQNVLNIIKSGVSLRNFSVGTRNLIKQIANNPGGITDLTEEEQLKIGITIYKEIKTTLDVGKKLQTNKEE